MIPVLPPTVHILQHPTKDRRYIFRVIGDEVEMVRCEAGWRKEKRVLKRSVARSRYAWLLKLGYERW